MFTTQIKTLYHNYSRKAQDFFPFPYSLLPTPCSLFPTPYSLLPAPYSLFPLKLNYGNQILEWYCIN
ncbi:MULTISPECIES: hypothetical protein [Moorena]|uniref:hypothetical protein n=1 Tax=Moorena TaxID=1155738 RepID=UPI0002FF5267|nr:MULTISPECIES: hypothetical protein [Moorena]NEP36413.1 hypothetical protein [Moorena sp. SIO3B2]NEP65627.1 hypothetical protein [Moorena sp. SIO3A5]